MATLLIVKNQGEETNFSHYPSDMPRFEISDFYVDIDDGMFQVKEFNGGKRDSYLFSDVSVRDDSSGGIIETFSSIVDLVNRLIQLKYPAYWKLVIGDNPNAAALISVNPGNQIILGSDGLLYVSVSSGGSDYTTFRKLFIWNTGDDLIFTLAINQVAENVFIDRQVIIGDSDDDIPFIAEWTQTDLDVELNSSVIDTYLFDGSLIYITGITTTD